MPFQVPETRSTVFDKLTDARQYTGAHKHKFALLSPRAGDAAGSGASPRARRETDGGGGSSPRRAGSGTGAGTGAGVGSTTGLTASSGLRGSPSAASDTFGQKKKPSSRSDKALKAVFQVRARR